MTLNEAKALLFARDFVTLENGKPIGVLMQDVIAMVINAVTGNELSDLGNVYGLKRQWYMYGCESDNEFGKRLSDHIYAEMSKPERYCKTHPSMWASSGDSVIAKPGKEPNSFDVEVTIKIPCWTHKWKHYEGIMDSFDFCEVCDEKRRK